MNSRRIKIKSRFFVGVEGESERGLVKFIQQHANSNDLSCYLDCRILYGGGYQIMLKTAEASRKRELKKGGKYKKSFLLIDEDRAIKKEDIAMINMKQIASSKDIRVCFQKPNLEGLYLRMFPGNERLQPNVQTVHKQLKYFWPEYYECKPVDSYTLNKKYKLEDLLRVATFDPDLKILLEEIGFII